MHMDIRYIYVQHTLTHIKTNPDNTGINQPLLAIRRQSIRTLNALFNPCTHRHTHIVYVQHNIPTVSIISTIYYMNFRCIFSKPTWILLYRSLLVDICITSSYLLHIQIPECTQTSKIQNMPLYCVVHN